MKEEIAPAAQRKKKGNEFINSYKKFEWVQIDSYAQITDR